MSQLILPTATGLLTALNDEVVQRRRLSVPVVLVLPKFRSRAWMLVNEACPLVITTPPPTETL